jgi:GTP-binding protein HflX
LKAELEKVRVHRQQYRSKRKKSQIPLISLVGYTNAGKSTLLNRLASSDVYVADQLFATLDPTTRRIELPGGRVVLMTDTVGFIQKLPTALIAAFHATLEEISESDLLLHVVDITHANALAQAQAVYQTLVEIEADHIPVLTVLNKIDLLSDPERARQTTAEFANSVAISALRGEGIPDMLGRLDQLLYDTYIDIEVQLPYQQGGLISLFHEHGQVEQIEHIRGGVIIHGKIPARFFARFQSFTTIDRAMTEDDVFLSDENEI